MEVGFLPRVKRSHTDAATSSELSQTPWVGLPWEGPLSRLATSRTGPVARVGGIAAIVIVGLGFAFSEGGGGMRKVLWVVAGLTIAFNAVGWALPFLGFSGGLTV